MNLLVLSLLIPAQLPTVESREFSKTVQEAALQATVRIAIPGRAGEGSGVILKQQGKSVYILTAGHVVERGDALEIATFSAQSYPKPESVSKSAEVLARSLSPDLAVIRMVTADKVLGTARLCPIQMVPEGGGFVGLTIGCSGGKEPTCLLNKLLGKRRIEKPGERDATLCWEAASAPAQGRSGGPLFDRRGQVIGITSGAGDGRGYFTHVEEIAPFLRRNSLAWLLE